MVTTRRIKTDGKRKLVEELVQKARVLALVNGVLRTTLAARSLPEVLMALAPNLKELCPFDRLSVSLYDPRRFIFHTPYAYMKARVEETGESPKNYERTPQAQVIETRRPLLLRQDRSGPLLATDTAVLKKGPGCEAIFPLLIGDAPFGTFQIGCLERDRLLDVHVEQVLELIPAISSAVHRFAGSIPG
ncbi:MAG TPA: GAF domain-containing protein [Planctomycetota bacterium]